MAVHLTDFPLSPSASSNDSDQRGFAAEQRRHWGLDAAEEVDVYETAATSAGSQGAEPGEAATRSPDEFADFVAWLGQVSGTLVASAFYAARFLATSVLSYARTHPVHCVANLVFVGTIGLLLATGFKVNDELITQRLSGRTLSDLIAASQYTRAYSLGELEQRKEREFLRVGAPEWVQRESIKAILAASRSARLSLEHQAVLLATAEVESGFNPMANAATTSACGVFQFIRTTGESFGLEASDCLSPSLSATAAIAHYMRNYQKRIEDQVASIKGPEKMFRMFELSYYLHHDGASSSNPSDELRATVLAGTPFLFKAYEILQREERARQQEATFVDNLEVQLDNVVVAVQEAGLRLFEPLTRSGTEGEAVEQDGSDEAADKKQTG